MAKVFNIYFWKKAPFLRLVVFLIAGIVVEFYVQLNLGQILLLAGILAILFCVFNFLPENFRFRYRALHGIVLAVFMMVTGIFLTWQKDIRHHNGWYGKALNDSSYLIAVINEPLIEKAKSYKALAKVEYIVNGKLHREVYGNLLLYFAKDSVSQNLKYGDRVIIGKKLQEIQNSGNPATFDYARYLSFQQIYHQCYLTKKDWIFVDGGHTFPVKSLLFKTREYVIKTIDLYVSGDKESGLAKALLIGYRVDLDKDLIQAYSNAGVIHLIAISGLHLALIYGLLLWATLRIPYLKKSVVPRLVAILFCLWFFSFLTGAPPSVLRAAVMFTFISIGTVFNKKLSIYNSLCISAFILLCIDPFILWDVGFQLSYLAVLGIVVAQRYIFHWFFFKNKILNYIWEMASISIAAQLFTIPACFFYFHQLPLLFLIANLIAIPLATVALWGCIALVCVSPIKIMAVYCGKILTVFLFLMNKSVLLINKMPYSLWDGVYLTLWDTILLYFIFTAFLYWVIKRNMAAFKLALAAVLAYTCFVSFAQWNVIRQKKMIVYNIPKHSAIDFYSGGSYQFVGDTNMLDAARLKDWNIKPSRIYFHAYNNPATTPIVFFKKNFIDFCGKRVFIVDTAINYMPVSKKIQLDYLIISKNPKLTITNLCRTFSFEMIIFDASNSWWKIDQWKKECEELHLHFHSVSEQGAFVINL